jgi:hypothetical protein
LRERHEVVKRAVTQGGQAEPFVSAGLALKPVPAPKEGYLLKISEYVTLSAERKCHPLANQPSSAS